MSVLNNPMINDLINGTIWREVNKGTEWSNVQVLEHQMIADQAAKYLASENKESQGFDFIRDEAEDGGVTPEQYCQEVLVKAELYSRMLRAARRARTIILTEGKENDKTDDVIVRLRELLPELTKKYVTFDSV